MSTLLGTVRTFSSGNFETEKFENHKFLFAKKSSSVEGEREQASMRQCERMCVCVRERMRERERGGKILGGISRFRSRDADHSIFHPLAFFRSGLKRGQSHSFQFFGSFGPSQHPEVEQARAWLGLGLGLWLRLLTQTQLLASTYLQHAKKNPRPM